MKKGKSPEIMSEANEEDFDLDEFINDTAETENE